MARQKAFLVIGLGRAGDVLYGSLQHHREQLATHGVQQPARSEEEMFRAAVWIRHDHRAWSLKRKDIEGSWSAIWRHAWSTKDTVVLGHPLLAGMTREEIALTVDRFPGFAVHVVVLLGAPDPRVSLFPDELDLADVLRRWSRAVKSPERLHVLPVDAADPTPAWQALARVVGFDAGELPLASDVAVAPRADATTLRLIAESGGASSSPDELAELAAAWAKLVAEEGYDVHGDLRGPSLPTLAAEEAGVADTSDRISVLSDALSESVVEIVRLRDRVALPDQQRAKSERKRRKLKKRLRSAT